MTEYVTKNPRDLAAMAIRKATQVLPCPMCGAVAGKACLNVGLGEIHPQRLPRNYTPAQFLSLELSSAGYEDLAGKMLAQFVPIIRVPSIVSTGTIDWELASKSISCNPGMVVVEMLPVPETQSLILLPDRVQNLMRPHVGVVLQSGRPEATYKGQRYFAPDPGEIVIVRPGDGTWIDDANMGVYQPKNQVRVYGVYGEFEGAPQLYYWWDSILASYNDNMVRAYGDKIVMRRDKTTERTEGGVFLINGMHKRTAEADVVSVGPFEPDIKVGDRVCYDPYHLEQIGVGFDSAIDYDLVIGSRLSINYILEKGQ